MIQAYTKTPFFIIGAALIFWGVQTGHPVAAAALVIAVEGLPRFRFRWQFTDNDFSRFADLSTGLFLVLTAYILLSRRSVYALFEIIQWLPLSLAPIYLAQEFSTAGRVPVHALFLVSRKNAGGRTGRKTDLTFPYMAACILAASAANARGPWFFPATVLLVTYALWPMRSRRWSPLLWGGLLATVSVGGHFGHTGIHHLQGIVEEKGYQWFSHLFREPPDPFRRATAIGDITALKGSDRIVLRMNPGRQIHRPELLRASSYNRYRKGIWFAEHARFSPVPPDGSEDRWRLHPLHPHERPVETATITLRLTGGNGMLPLPSGAASVSGFPATRLLQNQFGAVKAENSQALASYSVEFVPGDTFDAEPSAADLELPESEREGITAVAYRLRSDHRKPAETLSLLKTFFAENFTYSMSLAIEGDTPLTDFLLTERSGHCEYFATSAVMLLRAAGIPARFATGFAVREFSRLERQFVARSRHAHAWVLAHVNGRWIDFDPTPPSWADLEERSASFWTPVADLWSWAVLKYGLWQKGDGSGKKTAYLWWLLVPLALLLLRRLSGGGKLRTIRAGPSKAAGHPERAACGNSGSDSPFYAIEARLSQAGYPRFRFETLRSWRRRIGKTMPETAVGLEPIVDLHYRLRFDPDGITPEEKKQLADRADQWLASFPPPH